MVFRNISLIVLKWVKLSPVALAKRTTKTYLVISTRTLNFTTQLTTMSTVFVGTKDRFKGITVTSQHESCEKSEFPAKLERSLKKWTEEGVRAVWFYVAVADSEWVPILAKNGFTFHNANSERVAMIKWLPKDEANQIPPYAHHMVGVGGMVVNDKDEILAISEKYSLTPHWKLPGGYVDPGENLADAVVREVKEETGIDTEFQSLVAIRHAHGYNFGCSDLYIILHLKPLSSEISLCTRELSDCKWMPIREYAEDPLVNNLNQYFARKFLENRSNGIVVDRTEMVLKIKTFERDQQVFSASMKKEEEEVGEKD